MNCPNQRHLNDSMNRSGLQRMQFNVSHAGMLEQMQHHKGCKGQFFSLARHPRVSGQGVQHWYQPQVFASILQVH